MNNLDFAEPAATYLNHQQALGELAVFRLIRLVDAIRESVIPDPWPACFRYAHELPQHQTAQIACR